MEVWVWKVGGRPRGDHAEEEAGGVRREGVNFEVRGGGSNF